MTPLDLSVSTAHTLPYDSTLELTVSGAHTLVLQPSAQEKAGGHGCRVTGVTPSSNLRIPTLQVGAARVAPYGRKSCL